VTVNGKKVNIPSYRVKEGDVIEVREKSRQMALVIEALASAERDFAEYINMALVIEALASAERDFAEYINVDASKMKAEFVRTPVLADVPYPVIMEPNLVVEYYAKN